MNHLERSQILRFILRHPGGVLPEQIREYVTYTKSRWINTGIEHADALVAAGVLAFTAGKYIP